MLPALASALAGLRAVGVTLAWFVRKDPGLRVRVGGPLSPAELLAAATGAFDGLQARGVVAAWFPSAYEPETHQFGGPAATEAVHAYFDADTRALLRWSALPRRRVSDAVLSLAVLNDMFLKAVGAPEEVWDVWCNLAGMYRGLAQAVPEIPAIGLPGLRRLVGPEGAEVAAIYDAAHAALAGALAELWRGGALLWGRRAILPFVAAFHWNRYAFPAARMAELAEAMRAAWSPKRGMIGAEVRA